MKYNDRKIPEVIPEKVKINAKKFILTLARKYVIFDGEYQGLCNAVHTVLKNNNTEIRVDCERSVICFDSADILEETKNNVFLIKASKHYIGEFRIFNTPEEAQLFLQLTDETIMPEVWEC